MLLTTACYIEPRNNELSLDGNWDYTYLDAECPDITEVEWNLKTRVPLTTYLSLYESGILPDPYVGTNCLQYSWVDEKIWYYRKKFTLDRLNGRKAYLCFDGISYYSRVWLNGILIGEHEGMFGGPVADITEFVSEKAENTLVVEVKAANYGKKSSWCHYNRDGSQSQIVPWNLIRDSESSNGQFIAFGIWRPVRIELLPEVHLHHPYLSCTEVSTNTAHLHFMCELVTPEADFLKYNEVLKNEKIYDYTYAYIDGLRFVQSGKKYNVKLTFSYSGKTVKEVIIPNELYDYSESGIMRNFYDSQFCETDITIENPKLWYPAGLGNPELYQVRVTLLSGNNELDSIEFDYGIRMVTADYTTGHRYRERWGKFSFSVNGKKLFIKGINWMPIDFLLNASHEDYRWALDCVREAGIQLIRVWSGGGIPEDDEFYRLCDKYGIMVWQDNFIANMETPNWDQNVLDAQVRMNLYRIRNHPSLCIHCGGNEFNPYAKGNAASMYIIERDLHDVDPERPYFRTTPDMGSAHVYRDMEPCWYRSLYTELPFLAESGIHCFPNFKSLKALINEKEASKPLTNIFSEKFRETNPELVNHFIEFMPQRIPRMMSRASHITDIHALSLAEICEATQLASYEYYQHMIEFFRENYPLCGGIMPWVFKRPFTSVAIQLVDGNGDTTAPYYAVKNAYSATAISVALNNLTFAPLEYVSLPVTLIADTEREVSGLLELTVLTKNLDVLYKKSIAAVKETGEYKAEYDFGGFEIPAELTDTQLYIYAAFKSDGKTEARKFYRIKCLSAMTDVQFRENYRSEPHPNLLFEKGPWLKTQWQEAPKAILALSLVDADIGSEFSCVTVKITNESKYPAYPVAFSITQENVVMCADDSFFFLEACESRVLRLRLRDVRNDKRCLSIGVSAWNAESCEIVI